MADIEVYVPHSTATSQARRWQNASLYRTSPAPEQALSNVRQPPQDYTSETIAALKSDAIAANKYDAGDYAASFQGLGELGIYATGTDFGYNGSVATGKNSSVSQNFAYLQKQINRFWQQAGLSGPIAQDGILGSSTLSASAAVMHYIMYDYSSANAAWPSGLASFKVTYDYVEDLALNCVELSQALFAVANAIGLPLEPEPKPATTGGGGTTKPGKKTTVYGGTAAKGTDWTTYFMWGGIAVAVASVGYLGYRWWKSNKGGLHGLEKRMYYVAIVNGDVRDTHAALTKSAAHELANPDKGDRVQYVRVLASDAGEARLIPGRRRGW